MTPRTVSPGLISEVPAPQTAQNVLSSVRVGAASTETPLRSPSPRVSGGWWALTQPTPQRESLWSLCLMPHGAWGASVGHRCIYSPSRSSETGALEGGSGQGPWELAVSGSCMRPASRPWPLAGATSAWCDVGLWGSRGRSPFLCLHTSWEEAGLSSSWSWFSTPVSCGLGGHQNLGEGKGRLLWEV